MRRPDPEETGELGELLRFGTVSEVDLGQGRVVVDTGDVVSGPIRWLELRAGKTRTWSPPSEGEQVLLFCPEGDLAAAIAVRGVSSNAFPLPGNSLRELIEFEDGAVIAYDPEAHKLEALLPENATVLVDASGGVELNVTGGALKIYGDVVIEGDARIHGTVTADTDVIAAGKSLKGHKHLGVTAGGGVSGLPQ